MESAHQTLYISLMMDLTSNQSKRLLQMMKSDVSKIQRSCMLTMTNVKRGNQYTMLFFLSVFLWNVFSVGVFFPFPGLKNAKGSHLSCSFFVKILSGLSIANKRST